jgi:hypothetical protein
MSHDRISPWFTRHHRAHLARPAVACQSTSRSGRPFAKYAEEGPFLWLKSSIDTLRTNITKLILGVWFSGLLNKKAAKLLLHRFFKARSEVTVTERMGSVNAS